MPADVLPLTVLVPENAAQPIEIFEQHAALSIAIVDRVGVNSLNEKWNEPGVYLLVDRPGQDGMWGVYVGKAPSGLRTRLNEHTRNKDHWYRALLIKRDTTYGFNSAQIGWLEGRLYDLFETSEDGQLRNKSRPSDETLPPYDRQMLEQVILPIRRVLQLVGHDPAAPDDRDTRTLNKRSNKYYGIKVANLMQAGLLSEGTILISANNAWPAVAIVTPDGGISFNNESYDSPSAAAVAVRGSETNGWDFWAIQTAEGLKSLASLRKRYLETQN